MSDSEEPMVYSRPPEYETDNDWAQALMEQMWIIEDRAQDAEYALERIESLVGNWRAEMTHRAEWMAGSDD